MTITISRNQLRELNEEIFKSSDENMYKYLNEVADLMKDNKNIQVRKVDTASASKLKIYRYDRFLYRYVCDKIIVLA